jgi:hypothetical protein
MYLALHLCLQVWLVAHWSIAIGQSLCSIFFRVGGKEGSRCESDRSTVSAWNGAADADRLSRLRWKWFVIVKLCHCFIRIVCSKILLTLYTINILSLQERVHSLIVVKLAGCYSVIRMT